LLLLRLLSILAAVTLMVCAWSQPLAASGFACTVSCCGNDCFHFQGPFPILASSASVDKNGLSAHDRQNFLVLPT
jgi:hypothetical protein